MEEVIASRRLLAGNTDKLSEVIITIGVPVKSARGFRSCVKFSSIDKYNTKARGIDEINTIANAILYINRICSNSDDPRFFWESGEKYAGSDFPE